jgi:hypothetical protein
VGWVRRRGRSRPGVIHAVERISRRPFLVNAVNIVEHIFICVVHILLLLMILLINALGGHGAFDKR